MRTREEVPPAKIANQVSTHRALDITTVYHAARESTQTIVVQTRACFVLKGVTVVVMAKPAVIAKVRAQQGGIVFVLRKEERNLPHVAGFVRKEHTARVVLDDVHIALVADLAQGLNFKIVTVPDCARMRRPEVSPVSTQHNQPHLCLYLHHHHHHHHDLLSF